MHPLEDEERQQQDGQLGEHSGTPAPASAGQDRADPAGQALSPAGGRSRRARRLAG
ncbi:hypothetical protein Sru01_44870 [Sphaerisporangium rufum]|uniref:Uncharacterized protein n=1 Tax=Sphaerisporangium rufum TaxID=1381558 RepID=A0A919R8Y4_9ACTN|nr:hypothetical protein Sru01_44870 [Sphaerisporangium rufum]